MVSITNRIKILYNEFFNSNIDKNNADRITEHIISNLRQATTDYGLYLRNNEDSNIKEIENLFTNYVNQSKILNNILQSKNENNQPNNQQLELIYLDNGKLNIDVLP
jgi:hypothetical protein